MVPNIEDKDANCRLRHGLNVDCLSHIFQYLTTKDLYEVAGMNDFYKQIIHDLVIPKHCVTCDYLDESMIRQFFETFGARMRKVRLISTSVSVTKEFINSINQFCSTEQLKNICLDDSIHDAVLPNIFHRNGRRIRISNHLHRIEKFSISGACRLFVTFSDSLRYLYLKGITLQPIFEWSELINLTELHLIDVSGFDEKKFIGLLHRRPKLKYFHQNQTLHEYMQNIGDVMSAYCGDHIEVLHDVVEYSDGSFRHPQFYNFVAGMKNLKEVCLSTHRKCGADLIDPIMRLAENDTLETLIINWYLNDLHTCAIQNDMTYNKTHFKGFSHLKTFCFRTKTPNYDISLCEMKFLATYSHEILSNVEIIVLENLGYRAYGRNFIKLAPKLRKLCIYSIMNEPCLTEAQRIVLDLMTIISDRNNGQLSDDGETRDFITLEILAPHHDVFRRIDGVGQFIKLTDILENYGKPQNKK